jgi:hypothetical protein
VVTLAAGLEVQYKRHRRTHRSNDLHRGRRMQCASKLARAFHKSAKSKTGCSLGLALGVT